MVCLVVSQGGPPEVGNERFGGIVNDRGRSHQQPQPSSSGGSKFRADATHSRRAAEITDILEAVVAGKAREIAIARAVGDSVLYHSLLGLASLQPGLWGSLVQNGDYLLMPLRNAPNGIPEPWRVCRYSLIEFESLHIAATSQTFNFVCSVSLRYPVLGTAARRLFDTRPTFRWISESQSLRS